MASIRTFSDLLTLYVDGFKDMTWGESLWIIIFIKLFIMFAILRFFSFPDFLNLYCKKDKERREFVSKELTKNINP